MPDRKNIYLLLVAIIIVIMAIEILLRVSGIKPGLVNNFDGFTRVDSLVQYKNFVTDEAGIYKFSPWVTDSLLKYFDCDKREVSDLQLKRSLYESDKIYYLYESFCKQTVVPRFSLYWWLMESRNQEADSNCLVNTHTRITRDKAPADTAWRSAVDAYFARPFNHDGFRSIAFRNHQTKQLKVLIIGDSFVYGMDAHPFQNSFVDLLLSRGYMVYAAGVPGTDPAQYAAIAGKYIPILKPDVVISCFYTGNDFMKFEREPDRNRPLEHMTNAGLYNSAPIGKYMEATEAYRYYLSLSTFPDAEGTWFDRICSHTAIGTLVWNTCLNKRIITHTSLDSYYTQTNVPPDTIDLRTRIYTQRMKALCAADSVPLINVIIPEVNPLPFDTLRLGYIFDHHYSMPSGLDDKKDYFKGGIHFNNDGAFKYANFLDTLLQPYALSKASSF